MGDAERREIDFDSQDLGMAGITEDEQREIEDELRNVVDQMAKPPAMPKQYALPQRSGVLLPIMVWVFATAIATGGYFLLRSQFETRENDITVEGRQFFGTEAQLISDIIQENERRLAEKDAEIDQIQDQLALLNRERDQFEENLEAEVAEREAELRAELEAELAAERARLAAEGVSEEDIDQQIATLESTTEAELQDQVSTLQAQAQEQLATLEQQLAEQEAELEAELAQSREEREQIEAEANERVAEAEARAAAVEQELGQEIEALEQTEAQALEQIQQLREQRESDQLLSDRILGSYAVIVEDIQEGFTDQAIDGLDNLQRLLLDEQAAGGDNVQLQTELALTSTLRGLVREVGVLRQNLAVRDLTTTDGESAAIERERAAELIQTAAETATLAEQAREAGRFTEARTLYQQSLATIPSLETVYPGILDLEATRRQVALQSTVSEAQTLLADGEPNAAVDRYLAGLQSIAANADDPLLDVASGIDAAVSLTADELLDLQEEIQNELQATIAERNQQIATLQNQLATARSQAETATLQLAPLRERITELEQENEALAQEIAAERSTASDSGQDVTALEDRIADLEGQLAAVQADREDVQQLSTLYQRALGQAQTQLNTGQASAARRTLLNVFARPEATELFPEFTTSIERAHRAIVQEAESQTGGQARAEAISNVISLAEEVQENIDDPRRASSVQSYLRREPDLQGVGTELFEIVELASRQISAPEVEYRLLGSVSRVTGNLIVVERLVTTPTEVGTAVELRRTPSLGQEIPIGQGRVLEVSEERVLVSVEEIFDLELPPRPRDVVYLEQP